MAKVKKPKYYIRPDGLHETIRKINGKRVAFRGKTDAEVERKMLEYNTTIKKGRKFEDVADEWWEHHEPTLAENTKMGYHPAYRRAKEQYAKTPIKDIRPQDVQKHINEFARGRSRKTVTNQLLILNLIFAYAVVNGDAESNPCTFVKVPKGLNQAHREAASPEDEKKVEAYASEWLLPYFILCTGLRKGEALALTDKDFVNGWINVTKSAYYATSNAAKIKEPKTEKGVREVPVIRRLKEKMPAKWTGYLFSKDGGKTPLTKLQYRLMWEKMQRETGVTCTAHQLRHSYATLLYDKGIQGKDAQDLLGHAQLSTTTDIYTHLRQERRTRTAAILDDEEYTVGSQNTVKTQ